MGSAMTQRRSIPTLGGMMTGVFRIGHHLQILGAVIVLCLIAVMHNLIVPNQAPQLDFHHEMGAADIAALAGSGMVWHVDQDVPMRVSGPSVVALTAVAALFAHLGRVALSIPARTTILAQTWFGAHLAASRRSFLSVATGALIVERKPLMADPALRGQRAGVAAQTDRLLHALQLTALRTGVFWMFGLPGSAVAAQITDRLSAW